jgi:hypothetical protein
VHIDLIEVHTYRYSELTDDSVKIKAISEKLIVESEFESAC